MSYRDIEESEDASPTLDFSHDAFLQEVIVWLPQLQRCARSLCRESARAEDLVHDTVLRARAKQHYYTPGTNLCAWLLTLMRNCFVSQLRHRSYECEDPWGMHCAELTTPPEHDAHMRMRDLQRAWQRLPGHQQRTLKLVYMDGLSHREAARICGISLGTVKSRGMRARDRLTDLLVEDTSSKSRRSYPLRSLGSSSRKDVI